MGLGKVHEPGLKAFPLTKPNFIKASPVKKKRKKKIIILKFLTVGYFKY